MLIYLLNRLESPEPWSSHVICTIKRKRNAENNYYIAFVKHNALQLIAFLFVFFLHRDFSRISRGSEQEVILQTIEHLMQFS